MQTTLQAKVSKRLLQKADRLFTGTLAGRVIEILQNARRAGASEVTIENKDGLVSVHDNGRGIEDFSKLLDLGDSDWDQAMEKAEDPAGVGLFCLAPRKLTIRSRGLQAVITKDGWTGRPIRLTQVAAEEQGATLIFADEPWVKDLVEKHAVFTGLKVIVDGKDCAHKHFIRGQAVAYPRLGCRIEVCEQQAVGPHHQAFKEHYYHDEVLINFHGQVIAFGYSPVGERLQFLVDMTGQATGLRMMLPARTQPVENKALRELRKVLEIEGYRFIQRRGSHKLTYKEFLRAAELGIELPEAQPRFQTGTLRGDTPEPPEVVMPKDFPLARCYRIHPRLRDTTHRIEANVHLLAACGRFQSPFVPVDIADSYDGYSWAKLPTIDQVWVDLGQEIATDYLLGQKITAVKSIFIHARTSDGKTWESEAPLAVMYDDEAHRSFYNDEHLYVTPEAANELYPSQMWYFCGGFNEEGDTYDTQEYLFEQDLEAFWATVAGPGEYLRRKITSAVAGVEDDWTQITITSDGGVLIHCENGTLRTLRPPHVKKDKST